MANNTKKGVKYFFAGQYYTGSKDTAEQIKNYELEVVFAAVTPTALSLFKTSMGRATDALYKLMVKKYPDFKRLRTYTITNVVDLAGKAVEGSTIATMNTAQLTKYIKENDLDIDVAVYKGNITRLREMILLAKENPEGFKDAYAADVQAYEFNKSIEDLNDVEGEEAEGAAAGEKSDEQTEENGEVDAEDLLGDLDGVDE